MLCKAWGYEDLFTGFHWIFHKNFFRFRIPVRKAGSPPRLIHLLISWDILTRFVVSKITTSLNLSRDFRKKLWKRFNPFMNQRLKRFYLKNSERISRISPGIFCFKKEQPLIPIQIKMIRKELVHRILEFESHLSQLTCGQIRINLSFLFRLTLFEAEYIIVKKGSEKWKELTSPPGLKRLETMVSGKGARPKEAEGF